MPLHPALISFGKKYIYRQWKHRVLSRFPLKRVIWTVIEARSQLLYPTRKLEKITWIFLKWLDSHVSIFTRCVWVSHIILPGGSIFRVYAHMANTPGSELLPRRAKDSQQLGWEHRITGCCSTIEQTMQTIQICGGFPWIDYLDLLVPCMNGAPQCVQTMIDIKGMLKWGCVCSLFASLRGGLFSPLISDSLSCWSPPQVQCSEGHRPNAIVLLLRWDDRLKHLHIALTLILQLLSLYLVLDLGIQYAWFHSQIASSGGW